MIVIDEYLLVRVVLGDWPNAVADDEDLLHPLSRHWRLLQALLVRVLDSRVLLDEAAQIAGRWGAEDGWSLKPSPQGLSTDERSGSVVRRMSAG